MTSSKKKRMPEKRKPMCDAVRQRRELTGQIRDATQYHGGVDHFLEGDDGSEAQMLEQMSILQGIVNEYRNGGDQMVEECTCGAHIG